MRKRTITGAMVLGLALVLALAPTTTAGATVRPVSRASQSPDAGAAYQLFDLVNGERTSQGLPALEWREDVAAIARDWSVHMAQTGQLEHNDAYFSSETRSAIGSSTRGENVAMSGSIEAAHRALMNSPPHYANIMSGDFTQGGFGAVQDSQGRWWVTQDFMRPSGAARAPAPQPEPEAAPEPEPEPEAEADPAPASAPAPAPLVTTTTAPPPAPDTTAAPVPTTVAPAAVPVTAAVGHRGEPQVAPTSGVAVAAAALVAMGLAGHLVVRRFGRLG
jgi:uncharacterized protein YkwD